MEYTGWSDEYINIGVSMPGNSTDIAPGDTETGYVAVFTGSEWKHQEDHRGMTVYSVKDKSPSIIDSVGPIPDGFVSDAPSSPYDVWNGEHWVKDADAEHVALVATAEAQKQLLITQANDYINSRQWPGKAAIKMTIENSG
ncbi:tail fiber assembly protein [Citrobacter sedlakii]|nr:tail fiber assembly protein [Citrobacter sedlakii]